MFIDKDEFLAREKGNHSYNISDYDFLSRFNKQLVPLENELMDNQVKEDFPNIFILGLPRSGTTLLSQVIFNNLDVACTNNLIARFWDTPLSGTYLSKIVLGNVKPDSYNSKYAATDSVLSPHEFAYFWRKHFLSFDVTTSYPVSRVNEIDWAAFQKIILNMNRIMGKGFVHKPLEIPGYYLEHFLELFKKSIYVYIKRDLEDVVVSIAKARLEHYNVLNRWWGTYPVEYFKLADKNYAEQIAGQIYYLKKMYDENCEKYFKTNRIIIVEYKDLCNDPKQLLNEIMEKVKSVSGYELKQVNEMKPLKHSVPVISEDIRATLKESLKNYFK
jgi:sulfotransferase family protein